MRVACIAFTQRGLALACILRDALSAQGDEVAVSCPARLCADTGAQAFESLQVWAEQAWSCANALLFVSACGIATRAIAPLVRDKFEDPAVVCVDEAASFVIPLLSGHVGGANELARRVAAACGAQAVVTTATDVNDVFAVDEWAKEQGLVMLDREEAKRVSMELLEGRPVGFASDVPFAGDLPGGVVMGGCVAGFSVSYDAHKRPFAHTLRLVPHNVVVGVGCKRGTSAEGILRLVDTCLEEAGIASEAVCAFASIDVKADEPGLVEAAQERGWDMRFYSAEQLAAVPGTFSSSAFVYQTVGVDNVCERAACAEGARLLLGRRSGQGVTVALAAPDVLLRLGAEKKVEKIQCAGRGDTPVCTPIEWPAHALMCVGLGPGGSADLTLRARQVLEAAEVIVGYSTYVGLIQSAYPRAELVTTGMRGEVKRCRMALERAAAGQRVAVVCSGDPGIYGMAGLLLELAPEYSGVNVEVVAGVSAANGGAAVLGAPLMHDWCCISLSDLMTPWRAIEKRLRAAAQADFCIALYNPSSAKRADYLRRACDILLKHKSPDTVCGYVRNIGREGQASAALTLAELREAHVDMLTCVFVGNAQTKLVDGRMVTPRGYLLCGEALRDGEAMRGSEAAQGDLALQSGGTTRTDVALQSDKAMQRGDATQRRSVLLFGGTTEGRQLAEWLSGRGTCDVVYCTATEYGAHLVIEGVHAGRTGGGRIVTVQGPLSQAQKEHLMADCDVACIVDATHPYAQHISQSIDALGATFGKDVIRVVRAESATDEPGEKMWIPATSVDDAAHLVARMPGNILLTTGTKGLRAFVSALPDFKERLFVRTLPLQSSLAIAAELGVSAKYIVAQQGPFSTAFNAALIRELDIAVMVTKRSGPAGGFDQKVQAAKECGIDLVVIDRPNTPAGLTLEQAQRVLEDRYGA